MSKKQIRTSVDFDPELYFEFKKVASKTHMFHRGYTKRALNDAIQLYALVIPLLNPIYDEYNSKVMDLYGEDYWLFVENILLIGIDNWLNNERK